MIILKEGKPRKKRLHKYCCPNCACIFATDKNEDFYDEYKECVIAKCPTCHLYVDWNDEYYRE